MIKKAIIILACGALFAPVAFAQTRSTHKKQTTAATEQPITVTGTIIKMTTGEGSAANTSRSKLWLFARIVRILQGVMF